MRSFISLGSCGLLILVVSALTLVTPAAGASQLLFGQVIMQDSPRVDQFEQTIFNDRQLPCWVKASMPRLIRVASDDKMRVIVWKRMCRQELCPADHKLLVHIERIAEACNMPLRVGRPL